MLSETSFSPRISASMRSSIALRLSASRSSSSPMPVTGKRPERSPAMMRLRRLGHGIEAPQHAPRDEESARKTEHDDQRDRPARRRHDDLAHAGALFEIATDQQPEAAGELRYPHQRARARRSPARRDGDRPSPTTRPCRARRAQASRRCRRAPARSARSRDRGSNPAAASGSRRCGSAGAARRSCTARVSPAISVSTVSVICSVMRRPVLSAK